MRILLTILSLFFISSVWATDTDYQKKFVQANAHYEQGNLDLANETYRWLIQQGVGGISLYYNLGNYHYRKGNRGKAVLWFERAFRLAPRDKDIRFNLSLAKSHIKSQEHGVLESIVTYFTGTELSIALTVLIWAFFGLLGFAGLGKLKGEIWPEASLWTSGLLMVFVGSWLVFNHNINSENAAVVISPPGEVRNGPGNDYAVGFTIPEGSRVLILNPRPKWTQVGVPHQGLKGWMPTAEVEAISSSFPRGRIEG